VHGIDETDMFVSVIILLLRSDDVGARIQRGGWRADGEQFSIPQDTAKTRA